MYVIHKIIKPVILIPFTPLELAEVLYCLKVEHMMTIFYYK